MLTIKGRIKTVGFLNVLFVMASFLALGFELDWLFENLIWISVLIWSLVLLAKFMNAHDGFKTYRTSFLLVFLSAYVVRTAGLLMVYELSMDGEVMMVVSNVLVSSLVAFAIDCVALFIVSYEQDYMADNRSVTTVFNLLIMVSSVAAAVGGVNWFADICA